MSNSSFIAGANTLEDVFYKCLGIKREKNPMGAETREGNRKRGPFADHRRAFFVGWGRKEKRLRR